MKSLNINLKKDKLILLSIFIEKNIKTGIVNYMVKKIILFLILSFMQMININVLIASDNYLFIPSNSDFYIYGRGTAQFIIKHSSITDSSITDTIKKLASGKRIISASDDPSGLAMSQKLDMLL